MKNVLLALFFTIVFFSAGLLLGAEITHNKQQVFYTVTQDLFLETLSAELEYELWKDNVCQFISENNLDVQLSKLEDRLVHLESISDTKSDEFKQLKIQYFLVEIRHYLLFDKANAECEQKTNLILYFYGDTNCDYCENQGTVLLALRKKYDDVRVYSFDIESESGAVRSLLKLHGISQTPSVVFNGATHSGFIDYAALESLRESAMQS
jgi:glutaredoxin